MFEFLLAMMKTAKWSDEPDQRRLALLIFDAAIYESSKKSRGKPLDIKKILALTEGSGWSAEESADRFVHALSLIKPIADKATYRAAKEEGNRLSAAYKAYAEQSSPPQAA
ncbi:MAG: hypothetical protein ACR2OX_10895 [Methyloligellaceae bacterium]